MAIHQTGWDDLADEEPPIDARPCCNCGSRVAVRTGAHGLDFCLECIEYDEAAHPDGDYGEGD